MHSSLLELVAAQYARARSTGRWENGDPVMLVDGTATARFLNENPDDAQRLRTWLSAAGNTASGTPGQRHLAALRADAPVENWWSMGLAPLLRAMEDEFSIRCGTLWFRRLAPTMLWPSLAQHVTYILAVAAELLGQTTHPDSPAVLLVFALAVPPAAALAATTADTRLDRAPNDEPPLPPPPQLPADRIRYLLTALGPRARWLPGADQTTAVPVGQGKFSLKETDG